MTSQRTKMLEAPRLHSPAGYERIMGIQQPQPRDTVADTLKSPTITLETCTGIHKPKLSEWKKASLWLLGPNFQTGTGGKKNQAT